MPFAFSYITLSMDYGLPLFTSAVEQSINKRTLCVPNHVDASQNLWSDSIPVLQLECGHKTTKHWIYSQIILIVGRRLLSKLPEFTENLFKIKCLPI